MASQQQGLRPLLSSILVLAALLAPTATAGARVRESSPAVADELSGLLEQAEKIFYSTEQPDSVELLNRIIDEISERRAAGVTELSDHRLLTQALALRAEVAFNLGESQAAERDLSLALTVDPGVSLDPLRVSPKFFSLLEGLRAATIGRLEVLVTPMDARISLGDETIEPSEIFIPLLAGEYTALVERAGYQSVTVDLLVKPGEQTRLEVDLERSSAVLKVMTRPAAVEVFVDGQLAGVTEAVDDAPSRPPGGEALSKALVLDGLRVGPHELRFQKPGYRSRRSAIDVTGLRDFMLGPIELEPALATLQLSGLDSGATLSINGERRTLEEGKRGVDLTPGEYLVEVDYPPIGRFEQMVTLADEQHLVLEVVLRPTLALLSVGAPSAEVVTRWHREVGRAFTGLQTWSYLDRTETGRNLLQRFGLEAGEPSALVHDPPVVSWRSFQRALDEEIAASLYVAAVLRTDSPDAEPNFWFWSPAPDPVGPSLWQPPQGGDMTIASLIEALDEPLRFEAPWVGARFIDSPAAGAPVVTMITAESPATEAGLELGDVVRRVDGELKLRRRELLEKLAEGNVELFVERRGSSRRLRLHPRLGPFLPWPSRPGAARPIQRAALRARLAARELGAPTWLLALQQAGLLLGDEHWNEAADLLRTIKAPRGAGLGQGTVDYYLGVALTMAEPGSEAGRQALERASTVSGARLHFHDGPLLGPRAKVRLTSPER